MKAGPALAAWLADPSCQDRTLEIVNALARETSQRPLIRDLKNGLAALEVKDHASVRALVDRFLERQDELEEIFADLVARCAADPFARPPFSRLSSEITSGLLIYEDPALFLALNMIDVHALAAKKLNAEGPSSFSFTGIPTLYHFLRGGEATLSFWEVPEIGSGFAVDQSERCRKTGERVIRDGETLMIDGRRESFVIEHARSDIVFIFAAIRAEEAPLALEYDSKSHECIGASTTDEASSRIQMMVTLLRMMDRTDALPLFAQMLESPHFYTRWHVMREYLAMDAEGALPYLRTMAAEDPHPDVRAAARQTLAAYFPEEEAA